MESCYKVGICVLPTIDGRAQMQTDSIKIKAQQILNNLPDSATWDDLMNRIYVRQTIEAGIEDSDKGRTVDVKDVRKKFGLPE